MAQQVVMTLTDDLDGSRADETVRFALDGVCYLIDLTSEHAAELRDAFGQYIERARRDRSSGAKPRTRRPTNDARAIREWAARNNIRLSPIGRIPIDVVERWQAAHRAA